MKTRTVKSSGKISLKLPGSPKNGDASYTTPNKVELIRGGTPYFSRMLGMIDGAKHSIHLQTYIFDDDDTGKLIGEALKNAAGRGVNVYVMPDGYASNLISKSFIRELRTAGVHFRFFEPVIRSRYFYFGRRLHHKVIVTDAQYAMVGGINITERYNDRPGYTAWLDFAVFVEGKIVKELCMLCWRTWKGFPAKVVSMPCAHQPSLAVLPGDAHTMVRMRINDWVRNKKQISRSYFEMLRNARSHVVILCSYFLPGKTFRKNLVDAAKRGIGIKIILAGISDVKVAKYA
ncbi:phospholipase D-like domain-containing protein, partial [Agriterribacter sp.]|uniref:phospholipase D-like domain-containing protein n=1 Tax=Agriterribacter sp. TaxID=2821509 RepID=UPI002CB5123F